MFQKKTSHKLTSTSNLFLPAQILEIKSLRGAILGEYSESLHLDMDSCIGIDETLLSFYYGDHNVSFLLKEKYEICFIAGYLINHTRYCNEMWYEVVSNCKYQSIIMTKYFN